MGSGNRSSQLGNISLQNGRMSHPAHPLPSGDPCALGFKSMLEHPDPVTSLSYSLPPLPRCHVVPAFFSGCICNHLTAPPPATVLSVLWLHHSQTFPLLCVCHSVPGSHVFLLELHHQALKLRHPSCLSFKPFSFQSPLPL